MNVLCFIVLQMIYKISLQIHRLVAVTSSHYFGLHALLSHHSVFYNTQYCVIL